MDKNHPGQNLPDKNPEQKPREPLREILYKGFLSGLFVLLIIEGGSRCVTYFRGVPRCVTKCDRGASKLVKNSVTYFMDGPLFQLSYPDSTTRTHDLEQRLLPLHHGVFSASPPSPLTWQRIGQNDIIGYWGLSLIWRR